MDNYLAITDYIIPFLVTFVLAIIITWLVRKFALKKNIVDKVDESGRKIHRRDTPLLGGNAIFFSVLIVTLVYAIFSDRLIGGYLMPKYLWAIFIGGGLLMIGGYLDDKLSLKPAKQVIWPILAVLVIITGGIGVSYITNPVGGTYDLESIQFKIFEINNIPYYFVLLADIFAFVWLMGMMYTTKFLDGLDGLVSGITTIGAFVLFFLSITQEVAQPETALLSVILAGAALGFLVFNFYPAKIFLGEGGSLFTGFMLGVLSIISGAKIATALLIMGIPILDVLWVIIRRIFIEKKSPFSTADNKHLHFRLLDIGLSHRQAVILLYFISIVFGGVALIFSGKDKLIALIALIIFMVLLGLWVVIKYHKKIKQQEYEK
ncbi:MAG: MraY family glycosyltransferase [bacterium]|nr:MraY family glycosyltransferase [bacterium]